MPRENPRIKPRQPRPESQVLGPRQFKGSDFRDFPRLVVQMARPRPKPRAEVGTAARTEGGGVVEEGQPDVARRFANPLTGMQSGAYEGLRGQMQPQIDTYRTAVHNAYADNTLTPEEKGSLQQQRRGLRQDARSYKQAHPLQVGLGARLQTMPPVRGNPVKPPMPIRTDDANFQSLLESVASGRLDINAAIAQLRQMMEGRLGG